ncbi:hypothetical protein DL96DRAFT_1627662 [Flagelloscypha sp. PMI_526]|nr:hypothetical protein DL96DRAFT_1627662 [Flagelloscypha sp. PMI_526]
MATREPLRCPHSHSHSRLQSDKAHPVTDCTTLPASFIPRGSGRQRESAPLPSVVPPGYPDGTIWVLDNGWPRLMIPEQYITSHRTKLPPARTVEKDRQQRMVDVGKWAVRTEDNRHGFQPAVDYLHPQTAGLCDGSSPFSLSTSQKFHDASIFQDHRRSRSRQSVVPPPGFPGPVVDWRDIPRSKINFPFATVPDPPPPELPRRSRSHSRHRDIQSPDGNSPPVPFVPPRPRPAYQRKPAPVPSVVPPGYPEGTIWISDSNGRPRLVTPEQYISRYGTQSPTILHSGPNDPQIIQALAPQSRLLVQSQPIDDFSSTLPSTSSPPHKPFLKRMFGGFLGGRTDGPALPASVTPVLPVSRPLSRSKQRARTKSM